MHRRVGSSRAPASQNPVHTRGGYQCVPILELRVPSSWSCLGTSCWEPLLGNLFLGTSWEPYLGTCSWEPCLETLLGYLFLGTLLPPPCGFGCSEGFSWKRRPFPGTRFPTLRRADLAAPTCSGTFTMAEDPKLTLLGKNPPWNICNLISVSVAIFQSQKFRYA